MAAINIDVRDLAFEWTVPQSFSAEQWEEYLELERNAYSADFAGRSTEEIKTFLNVDSVPNYIARRLNPDLLIGDRHHSNQEYAQPHISLARNRAGEMVAAAYTVGNVSGSAKQLKKISPFQNYVALQSVVEAPDYAERGLIEITTALSVRGLRRIRRWKVYPFKEETAFIPRIESLGFKNLTPKPEPNEKYFGASNPPAEQYAYRAKTGQIILRNVVQLPGGHNALQDARRATMG